MAEIEETQATRPRRGWRVRLVLSPRVVGWLLGAGVAALAAACVVPLRGAKMDQAMQVSLLLAAAVGMAACVIAFVGGLFLIPALLRPAPERAVPRRWAIALSVLILIVGLAGAVVMRERVVAWANVTQAAATQR